MVMRHHVEIKMLGNGNDIDFFFVWKNRENVKKKYGNVDESFFMG